MPNNIRTDSKQVQNGDIFVAISCPNIASNVLEAAQKGAILIFLEHQHKEALQMLSNLVFVQDARLTASCLAKFCYAGAPECSVCVTGTNGKSSVVHFLTQIWKQSEKKAAGLGTLGLFVDGQKIENEELLPVRQTTPDPISLHKILSYLFANGTTHFAFEASSHAIDQKRLHSVSLYAAGFTNFSSDHLDYHKTNEKYFKTKLKLFEEILDKNRPAVVSKDFPEIYDAVCKLNNNPLSFGFSNSNFVRATNIKEYISKTTFDLAIGGHMFHNISINLIGQFQIMNILCAAAFAFVTGIAEEKIADSIANLKCLSGRMEHVCSKNGGEVYVDYAHTSEGFKQCLKTLKKICQKPGRVICIFGCGGDRDKNKRKEFGTIAQDFSNIAIITDDNPRTEDPASIRSEILSTCPDGKEIANRKDAIKHAMNIMQPNDILVVVGKGHETTQIYGKKTLQHDDKSEILNNRN